jgi:2,5-diketo-D-gluconate reductase A
VARRPTAHGDRGTKRRRAGWNLARHRGLGGRAGQHGDGALDQMAEKYGCSPAQLLIRWNLQRGTVPLPKANSRQHLEENIDVFGFEIEPDDLDRLDAFNECYSALGTLPYH